MFLGKKEKRKEADRVFCRAFNDEWHLTRECVNILVSPKVFSRPRPAPTQQHRETGSSSPVRPLPVCVCVCVWYTTLLFPTCSTRWWIQRNRSILGFPSSLHITCTKKRGNKQNKTEKKSCREKTINSQDVCVCVCSVNLERHSSRTARNIRD